MGDERTWASGEIDVEIKLGPYGNGWLATALDGDGELLAEATGDSRASVAAAIVGEAGSYLGGEDGWGDE